MRGVKVTKQKGFGQFDIAGYWSRKYRASGEDEGWYLLTNIATLKKAVSAFKCRSGIEAMFKDCKTGGYNLEKSHGDHRLKTLILLIALAYSCAILQGRKLKLMGIQKYIGRVTEWLRSQRGRSEAEGVGMEFCQEIVGELMSERRNKLPFFQRGNRAMSLILSSF